MVDCRSVGTGLPALQYLSRYLYLYRGVVSEKNIVALDTQAGTVTFRYRDSNTNRKEHRTLPIADFLYKLLQHLLPKGFRRVREFGFLHGVLRVQLPDAAPPGVQAFACRVCGGPLVFGWFVAPRPVT